LTSDLGNYIQGSGTADSIPKFTGTRTIANSAIRDTTSTVVISKNVSVDNGASQAINLTPASGGTTNRIETTGTLPLSLVTSGASITLAAGGVTPQFTLSSAGLVTLTGALNGTSAVFRNVGVPSIQVIRDLNVASVGPAGQGIEFGALNGSTPTAAAGIYGTLENPATTGNMIFQTLTGGSLTTKLTLASTGAATFSSSVTATTGLTVGSLGSGSNAIITLANNASGSPRTIYYKASDATINFTGTGGTDQVTITNGGNVGIGTASPTTYSLSGRHFEVNDAGGGFAFMHNNTTSVKSFFAANESGGVAALFTFSNHPLTFGTNNTERMRITSGGNVGIGTASPTKRLDVRASVAGEVVIISNDRNSAGDYGFVTSLGSNCNNTSAYHYIAATGGADRVYIFGNGNIQNTNNSYGGISDAKLKENIEDASPKLEDLLKVKVRNYNLIGEETKQIGVIAQELEEVFPAMIDESEDFEEVELPQLDEEGNEVLNEEGEVVTEKQRVSKGTTTKSVKYSVFVPMLIKAMQEQQEQIQELKTEIDSLKNQIK
jgi:hypothetical protein